MTQHDFFPVPFFFFFPSQLCAVHQWLRWPIGTLNAWYGGWVTMEVWLCHSPTMLIRPPRIATCPLFCEIPTPGGSLTPPNTKNRSIGIHRKKWDRAFFWVFCRWSRAVCCGLIGKKTQFCMRRSGNLRANRMRWKPGLIGDKFRPDKPARARRIPEKTRGDIHKRKKPRLPHFFAKISAFSASFLSRIIFPSIGLHKWTLSFSLFLRYSITSTTPPVSSSLSLNYSIITTLFVSFVFFFFFFFFFA